MKKSSMPDMVRRQSPANIEKTFLVPSTEKLANDRELVSSAQKSRFALRLLSLKSFVVVVVSLLVSTG